MKDSEFLRHYLKKLDRGKKISKKDQCRFSEMGSLIEERLKNPTPEMLEKFKNPSPEMVELIKQLKI
jgi:hypothetical protein